MRASRRPTFAQLAGEGPAVLAGHGDVERNMSGWQCPAIFRQLLRVLGGHHDEAERLQRRAQELTLHRIVVGDRIVLRGP